MKHVEKNSDFLEACKKNGFVKLHWEEKIDGISGKLIEQSFLTGNRYSIVTTVSHPFTKDPSNQAEFDNIRWSRVEIQFDYLTEMGNISSVHIHEANPYEKAKEYAEWKTTLIYKMLISLEKSNFTLEINQ